MALLSALLILSVLMIEMAKGETLRAGFRCDAPPFSYLANGCGNAAASDRQTPNFRGFIADVCNAVFREMRVEVIPVEVSAEHRLRMLDTDGEWGKAIDVLCDPTTATAERYRNYWFSQIVFLSGVSYMFVPGAGKAPDPEPGHTPVRTVVGFVVNTTAEARTNEMLRANVFGGKVREATTRAFSSHREAIAALCRQELDYYVADRDIILWFLKNEEFRDCNAATSGRFYSYEPYAIAVSRSKPELALRIQRALYEVVRRGEIDDALRRNFPGSNVSSAVDRLYKLYRIPRD